MDNQELKKMRSVQNIVRMGRATSIEAGKVILQEGVLDFTTDDTLLVDCMVTNLYGYDFDEDFTIFEPGKINMGPITSVFNVSMSAAQEPKLLLFARQGICHRYPRNDDWSHVLGNEVRRGHYENQRGCQVLYELPV